MEAEAAEAAEAAKAEAAEAEAEERDTESKTRTPHKDVGKCEKQKSKCCQETKLINREKGKGREREREREKEIDLDRHVDTSWCSHGTVARRI